MLPLWPASHLLERVGPNRRLDKCWTRKSGYALACGSRLNEYREDHMEFTVPNIYGLLLRSRLLSLGDARQMFERWQKEAKDDASNLGKFIKWMVAHQYLTEYQASLLARGHADSFFIKEYKILDRIGKGRMAGVYKAIHQLGQVVAIKILPPSKARDAQILGRFLRKARLAVPLKHPNIVRTFQMGESNRLHFIVMEYLEGETLDEVIQRRNRLSPTEAARIVYQALLGLQHIHERGLIHRDMKPGNLMLVPAPSQPDDTLRSTVKILDIGLGRSLFDEERAADGLRSGVYPRGDVAGHSRLSVAGTGPRRARGRYPLRYLQSGLCSLPCPCRTAPVPGHQPYQSVDPACDRTATAAHGIQRGGVL